VVRENWIAKDDEAVFKRSSMAFGPGHASFVKDRKGVDYVIYHATEKVNGGWAGRTIRAQSFEWKSNGEPLFPNPIGFKKQFPLPA
jgi:GH43 family beta-xylosidase